jgi:hypothetical protein
MIRLVAGFFTVFSAVSGLEFGDLSTNSAFFLGIIGLILMWAPVLDGSLVRLANKF